MEKVALLPLSIKIVDYPIGCYDSRHVLSAGSAENIITISKIGLISDKYKWTIQDIII